MLKQTDWNAKAQRIIRGAMSHKGVTYSQLTERLQSLGIQSDEGRLRVLLNEGSPTAAFFIACLSALEVRRLVMDAYDVFSE